MYIIYKKTLCAVLFSMYKLLLNNSIYTYLYTREKNQFISLFCIEYLLYRTITTSLYAGY